MDRANKKTVSSTAGKKSKSKNAGNDKKKQQIIMEEHKGGSKKQPIKKHTNTSIKQTSEQNNQLKSIIKELQF